MTAPLTPRERVKVETFCGNVSAKFADALAAELEEAKRRAEAAERQLARYREKYGELE